MCSPAWGGQTPVSAPTVVPAKGLWRGAWGRTFLSRKGSPGRRRPTGASLPPRFQGRHPSDTPSDGQHLDASQLSIGFELTSVVAVYEQLVVQRS